MLAILPDPIGQKKSVDRLSGEGHTENQKNYLSFIGVMFMKDRILETARDKFFQLGFARVTMDEIARDLGISKRTLYEHYASKETLLREVLKRLTEEIETRIEATLRDKSTDFLDKLIQVWTFLASKLSKIGPLFQSDLQRHAPEIWREVDARRARIIQQKFGELLKKGVQNKTFRRDIDVQFLILIYSTLIQRIINPETLSQLPFSASQAFEAILRVLFEGILTDQGRVSFQVRRVHL